MPGSGILPNTALPHLWLQRLLVYHNADMHTANNARVPYFTLEANVAGREKERARTREKAQLKSARGLCNLAKPLYASPRRGYKHLSLSRLPEKASL